MTPRADRAAGPAGDGVWAEREQVWLARRLGSPIEVYASLGSTNERASEWVRAGAGPWSVVMAGQQTAGRGRRGRRWESKAGLGLWMSVVVPIDFAGGAALPLLTGLAVARAAEACALRERRLPEEMADRPGDRQVDRPVDRAAIEPRVSVKWPNDLLLGRRKVGGILCEVAAAERVVAGVGVNLLHERDDFGSDVRPRAASLRSVWGVDIPPSVLALEVVTELRSFDRFDEIADGDLEELRLRDALRGRPVRSASGIEGLGAGIGPDGALLLRNAEASIESVRSGEIEVMGGL